VQIDTTTPHAKVFTHFINVSLSLSLIYNLPFLLLKGGKNNLVVVVSTSVGEQPPTNDAKSKTVLSRIIHPPKQRNIILWMIHIHEENKNRVNRQESGCLLVVQTIK